MKYRIIKDREAWMYRLAVTLHGVTLTHDARDLDEARAALFIMARTLMQHAQTVA